MTTTDQQPAGSGAEPPDCPRCDAAMVLRVAREGLTPGMRFWGCSTYPDCRGTRPYSPEPVEPTRRVPPTAASRTHSRGDAAERSWRRVQWHDETLTRPKWACRYATAGVSLRSLPSPLWSTVSNCWIASSGAPAGAAPSQAQTAVAAAVSKLMTRGAAAPLHPASEKQLLDRKRLGWDTPGSVHGDTTPVLHTPKNLTAAHFAALIDNTAEFDPALLDSDAEEAAVGWISQQFPHLLRWLVPQAPLDTLVEAAGMSLADETGSRRCDLLVAAPGQPLSILEIDGSQHRSQAFIDMSRDRTLDAAGVPVLRISAAEARAGRGAALDNVAELLKRIPDAASVGIGNQIVWAAAQTHRLVAALCDALAAGMLNTPIWCIRLTDPTGSAAHLVGPYLEMIDAFDIMWGDRSVAPEEVRFLIDDGIVCYQRRDVCAYEIMTASDDAASTEPPDTASSASSDVDIRLEADVGPTAPLPVPAVTPSVIVRSSGLPMAFKDHLFALPDRLAAFAAATGDEPRPPSTKSWRQCSPKPGCAKANSKRSSKHCRTRTVWCCYPQGQARASSTRPLGCACPAARWSWIRW